MLLSAIALYALAAPVASQPSTAEGPSASDITFGPEQASVVVIEYSDFQCEFCAQYAPILAELRAKYADRVRFVYRFFPLDYHQYGMLTARAAYAAFLQDKFWEMHDLLYQNQGEWAESSDAFPYIEGYAEQLGLDMDRFRQDLTADSTQAFITGQKEAGDKAGISHTPWFIVDGKDVTPRTLEDFEALIEAAL